MLAVLEDAAEGTTRRTGCWTLDTTLDGTLHTQNTGQDPYSCRALAMDTRPDTGQDTTRRAACWTLDAGCWA